MDINVNGNFKFWLLQSSSIHCEELLNTLQMDAKVNLHNFVFYFNDIIVCFAGILEIYVIS